MGTIQCVTLFFYELLCIAAVFFVLVKQNFLHLQSVRISNLVLSTV